MPPEGEPLQGVLASMSPSGNEDNPRLWRAASITSAGYTWNTEPTSLFQDRGQTCPLLCPSPTFIIPRPPAPFVPIHACPRVCARASGLGKGGTAWRDRVSPSVILFLWFSFQAVTVNLFYLSLCKSLCRIKPFTSF